MLTKITVRNFKRFEDVTVELGNPVVFVGPNNSGKTTVLQALALWQIGVQKWLERRGKNTPKKRPGVTINRRDLIPMPVPNSNLLWHDMRVRSIKRKEKGQSSETQNIRIEVIVEGASEGKPWICGLEFDYANEESFYCRPIRQEDGERMPVPEQAGNVHLAYLPPMSGLKSEEDRMDPGSINVRIGEGRTADVLRNLCYQVVSNDMMNGSQEWEELTEIIHQHFGVQLNRPEYLPERGLILLSYRERNVTLDISSAGRGLQQMLLLCAYIFANQGAILLLDEPDAHLEILRQRQIYQLITRLAREKKNQIIIATHSEVVLNEAAGKDTVVAFVGKPHTLNDRGNQVVKALSTIGFEQYYLAEQKRWVLYLEGSTDLAILLEFARLLEHPAREILEDPFVYYVGNQPRKAEDHFFGLREAVPDLRGIAIYDRLDHPLENRYLLHLTWRKNEIENYIFLPETLLRYAEGEECVDLFSWQEAEKRQRIMEACINDLVPQIALRNRDHSWWSDIKASELLDQLFDEYFRRLGLPNTMRKNSYHLLVRWVPTDLVSAEVVEKLDALYKIANEAINGQIEE